MSNLMRFFVRNAPFFTWLILTIISIILLCQRNPYHRSVWLGGANYVTGAVFEASANAYSYFGLRTINEQQLVRIGELEAENNRLKQMMLQYDDAKKHASDTITRYTYRIAHVVSNSIGKIENYLVLDKGYEDGVRQDQGVADHNGVVGIVSKVSAHYSLVISLLNPNLRLSVSLKNDESYGSLWWNGSNPRYALLEDLPRTVKFEKGDTVVTTSYSTSFPQGVPVGTVEESFDQTENNNFLTLRIRLFTDFQSIHDVHVIDNADAEEIKSLSVENI